MPTPITHLIISLPMNTAIMRAANTKKILLLSFFVSAIADIDFVGYWLGIDYYSLFGHRGFTHSFFFALLAALTVSVLFFRTGGIKTNRFYLIFFNFSFIALLHPVFDFLVNRNNGVALLAPFSNTRFSFPYAPIVDDHVGIINYLIFYKADIIKVEALYLIMPAIIFMIIWHKYLAKAKSVSNKK